MRSIIDWAIRQRVLVNLLFFLLLAVGISVYSRLPVDAWPEISLDEAWIQTFWDGAGAEDVTDGGTGEERQLELHGVIPFVRLGATLRVRHSRGVLSVTSEAGSEFPRSPGPGASVTDGGGTRSVAGAVRRRAWDSNPR